MVKNADVCDLDSRGEMEGKKESSNTQGKQLSTNLELEVICRGSCVKDPKSAHQFLSVAGNPDQKMSINEILMK